MSRNLLETRPTKTNSQNESPHPQKIRLNKWIAQLGLASRREADQWIKLGRVVVNGNIVKELGTLVDPGSDRLQVGGKPVRSKNVPFVYWMLHKPDFTLTARPMKVDEKRTIYDLPKLKKLKFHVSPVGRLDFRTEGLLLLTNDGQLTHELCLPENKVPRHYLALINGKLSREQLAEVRKGVKLDGHAVKGLSIRKAESKKLGASQGTWYFVEVKEGRNRVVRRVFEHFDFRTLKLIRYGFGDLRLPDDLLPGDYRQLTAKEIDYLKNTIKESP